MSCSDDVCGTGGWTGPKPGDPDNNVVLTATPEFGGVAVSWTYPSTNPYAVAHTLLYKNTSISFSTAVQIAVVAGSRYYDSTNQATPVTQYYWIQLVSVNGTIGATIGPASAMARPRIAELIEVLSGQIEESALGQTLRSTLGDITKTRSELLDEIGNRIAGNSALMQVLQDVQGGLVASGNILNKEIIDRTSGQSAVLSELETQASLNKDFAAAILTERTTRVTADSAMTADVVKAFSVMGANGAAIIGNEQTKIGYPGKANEEFYEGNSSDIVYPSNLYPTIDYPAYNLDRTRIIDKLGVDRWNALPVSASNKLVWYAGVPLAVQVKKIGIKVDGETNYQTIEQRATSQKLVNDSLLSQWTVKIDSGGRVAGFGLASTLPLAGPSVSRFIINADTFSISAPLEVGETTSKKVSPFIVDTGTGEVIIDDAVIKKLTVDKLKTADGGVLIQDGVIRIGSGIQDGATRNVFRGYWASNTLYALGDTVVSDGNNWESSTRHTSSTLNKPPTDTATVSVVWKVVSLRGQGMVKSIMFTRNDAATVAAPSGGSFASPNATTVGWFDGIPADNNKPLWMSSRIFTSDNQAPHQSEWTTPSKVASPSLISRPVFSLTGAAGTWHVTPATDDVFMATQAGVNGDFTNGAITGAVKIKGEKGDAGTSMDVQYSINGSTWNYIPTGAKYIRTGTKAAGATSFTYAAGVKFVPELGVEYEVVDGVSSYLHIKYSNDGVNFTSNNGETVGSWLGQYTDSIQADSNFPWLYTWKKIEGAQGVKGDTGTVGPAGAKGASFKTGTTAYTSVNAASAAGEVERIAGPNPALGSSVTLVHSGDTPWTQTWLLQDNGLWAGVQFYLDGNAVITGTLSASKLIAGSITTDRINGNSVTVPVVDTVYPNIQSGYLHVMYVPMTYPGKLFASATITQSHVGGTNPGWQVRLFINGTVVCDTGYVGAAFQQAVTVSGGLDIATAGTIEVAMSWGGVGSTQYMHSSSLYAVGAMR